MPTRAELEALADEAEKQRVALVLRAKESLRLARICKEQRDGLRAMAEKASTNEVLPSPVVKSRVNAKKMHAQHKLAISEGQAKRDKKFKDTIRGAKPGYTQAGLAVALGMKASLLSMCRSGERAMFLSRAKRCEELTGWPADKAHWPGGIIDDA